MVSSYCIDWWEKSLRSSFIYLLTDETNQMSYLTSHHTCWRSYRSSLFQNTLLHIAWKWLSLAGTGIHVWSWISMYSVSPAWHTILKETRVLVALKCGMDKNVAVEDWYSRDLCLLVYSHMHWSWGYIILCADIFVHPVHSPDKHRWQRCVELQCTSLEWLQAIALICEGSCCVVHSYIY